MSEPSELSAFERAKELYVAQHRQRVRDNPPRSTTVLPSPSGPVFKTMWAKDFVAEGFGVHFHNYDGEYTGRTPPPEPQFHNHDYFEFAYLHHGHAIHNTLDGSYELVPGDAVLLNPYVMHEMRVDGCLINLMMVSGFLKPSLESNHPLPSCLSDYFVDYIYALRRTSAHMFLPVREDSATWVRQLIEQIAVEAVFRKPGWKEICRSYLLGLLGTLGRELTSSLPERDGDAERVQLLRDIIDWLGAHYPTATLNGLAAAFNYSPSHLSRLIRAHTGRTFTEILHEIRMERVREQLENTRLPVAVIARQVGLGTESYLHRAFRRRYGVTPGQHREAHRANQLTSVA